MTAFFPYASLVTCVLQLGTRRPPPSSYMSIWASASRLASSSKCLRVNGTGLLVSESSAKLFAQIRESSTTNPSLHEPKKLDIPARSLKQRRKQRKRFFNPPPKSLGLPTAVEYDSSSFRASVKGKGKSPAKIVVASPPLQNLKHNPLPRSVSPSIVKAKVRKRNLKIRSSSVSTAGDLIHFAAQTGACANSGFFSQIHPLNLRQQQQEKTF